jgi:hypothetical protein
MLIFAARHSKSYAEKRQQKTIFTLNAKEDFPFTDRTMSEVSKLLKWFAHESIL